MDEERRERLIAARDRIDAISVGINEILAKRSASPAERMALSRQMNEALADPALAEVSPDKLAAIEKVYRLSVKAGVLPEVASASEYQAL